MAEDPFQSKNRQTRQAECHDVASSEILNQRSDGPANLYRRFQGWLLRIRAWLWGYDFFISYHWNSGGTYAVNLASRLRARGYDVFLDRSEFAMGDQWQRVGETAIHNTRRLVLIATREAVFESKPVAREVVAFTKRGRHVIPVFFGDNFADEKLARPGRHVVLDRLQDDTLYIAEEFDNLPIGPSDRVIDQLSAARGIMRQRYRRVLATAVALTLLSVFALSASVSWVNALVARDKARHERDAALESLDRARREGFGAQLGRIAQQLTPIAADGEQDLVRSRNQLDDSTLPVDLREFTWGLVQGLADPNPIEFSTDGQGVLACSITLDQRFLGATTNQDRLLIWNRTNKTLLHKFEDCRTIAFDNQVSRFATATNDHVIELRDIASGTLVRKFEGHTDEVTDVDFSSDGQFIASSSKDRTARVWSVQDASQVRILAEFQGPVNQVTFAEKDNVLFTASGNSYHAEEPGDAQKWDLQSGEVLATYGHARSVGSLSISQDQRLLATASVQDRTVKLWDMETSTELRSLRTPGRINRVTFGTSGYALAIATDQGLVHYESPFSDRRKRFPGDARDAVFGKQNKFIAVATLQGLIQVWDLRSANERNLLIRESDELRQVCVSSDLQNFAVVVGEFSNAEKTRLTLRSLTGSSDPKTMIKGKEIWSVQYSPDGRFLVVSMVGEATEIWNMSSRTKKMQLGDPNLGSRASVFSTNGRLLATVNEDNLIRLWNAENGTLVRTMGDREIETYCAEFSPDGKRLAVGGFNGKIRIYFTESGRIERELVGHTPKAPLHAIRYLRDLGIVSVANSEMLLWRAKDKGVPIPL